MIAVSPLMQATDDGACYYCSAKTCRIFHGGRCPQVRSIEYHPDGSVSRIVFYEPDVLSMPDLPIKRVILDEKV